MKIYKDMLTMVIGNIDENRNLSDDRIPISMQMLLATAIRNGVVIWCSTPLLVFKIKEFRGLIMNIVVDCTIGGDCWDWQKTIEDIKFITGQWI